MQPLNEAGCFKPRSTNPVDWPHTRCPPQKMSGQVIQTSKPGRPPHTDIAAESRENLRIYWGRKRQHDATVLHQTAGKRKPQRDADAVLWFATRRHRNPPRSGDNSEGRELLTRTHRWEPTAGSPSRGRQSATRCHIQAGTLDLRKTKGGWRELSKRERRSDADPKHTPLHHFGTASSTEATAATDLKAPTSHEADSTGKPLSKSSPPHQSP